MVVADWSGAPNWRPTSAGIFARGDECPWLEAGGSADRWHRAGLGHLVKVVRVGEFEMIAGVALLTAALTNSFNCVAFSEISFTQFNCCLLH